MHKLIIVIVVLLWCFQSRASDTIFWQTYHLPPILIKTGNDVGQGFVDKTLRMIIERMPQYQHEMPLTSHARALEDMRQGRPVCHPSLYITEERKQFARFSKASIIAPGHRLISNPKKGFLDYVEQPVNLKKLIDRSELVFGLTKGRSYGTALDSVLNAIPEDRLLRVSAEEADVILKLVAMGRLDVTVAYPYEVTYFNSQKGYDDSIRYFDIGGVEPYAIGYIACPDNDWGAKVIKEIDQVLIDVRNKPEYIQAMTSWWQLEREKPAFKAALKEVFGASQFESNL